MINPFKTKRYLTDGGLETDLIFNENFELPEFAACSPSAPMAQHAALISGASASSCWLILGG
jgi:hypothetical protein